MFTGIIEAIGILRESSQSGSNLDFCFESQISNELSVDQSVSHNGVCLTVTNTKGNTHWVTAIHETLKRSNLGTLKVGSKINLERCLKADGRFDGHIVQGHVDLMAEVKNISDNEGSWVCEFQYRETEEVVVDKGSITVNGVSLTCYDTTFNSFRVAIIPYTREHTNFCAMQEGDLVNLEFDILGKYVQKLMSKREH